ncbi:hypothetical protein FB566_2539 [Stackebrandtia endophytica]|uniref:Uncharacterized protein n=1 Tax=Stackebrandtia endophytica TaxID=1496996 RepID=A0A543AWN9_9ACTN|nr:hypothetical protein [Stackebrandtia endophytica]TQL76995.1 hypothetical protein FB566_2539 [Stackebrandtia endophytica]
MCVSAGAAEFSSTIIYSGRRDHPEHGLIHVLGYQNSAVNLAPGPNAMLLHVPTRQLRPDQFISIDRDREVLSRMGRMVDRSSSVSRAASMDWMSGDVHVFDHDLYTVVVADDPLRIPDALSRVEPRKRPDLTADLLEFYSIMYSNHVMVLCCFDNADVRESAPILLWYRPTDPDRLVMPAIDAHTGRPPLLGAPVRRDHVLVFGTDAAADGWGTSMTYPRRLRRKTRSFLPDAVGGFSLSSLQVSTGTPHPLAFNGDFAIAHTNLLEARLDRVVLATPDGS